MRELWCGGCPSTAAGVHGCPPSELAADDNVSFPILAIIRPPAYRKRGEPLADASPCP
jgi:hypothetical protein